MYQGRIKSANVTATRLQRQISREHRMLEVDTAKCAELAAMEREIRSMHQLLIDKDVKYKSSVRGSSGSPNMPSAP